MRALVLGCGISGFAAARYLKRQGASVVCIDRNASELAKDPRYADFEVISDASPLPQAELLVKSPGIRLDHPLYLEAQRRSLRLTSEIELGVNHLQNTKRLLGITGSNGKTTTTLLVQHVLAKAGFCVKAVGNVGSALLDHVEGPEELLVLELSSFQLEMLSQPFLDAAVLLNITPNHLDRYRSFEEYAAAKWRIAHCVKPHAPFFFQPTFPSLTEKYKTLFPHDRENMQAAFALCAQMGVDEETFCTHASTFQKPPHRLEPLQTIEGVGFVNDSKSTSVDALRRAVEALEGPLLLILGGVDKGGDFHRELLPFKKKIREIFAIGPAQERLVRELTDFSVTRCTSLREATLCAYKRAQKGETVLLSPGCSSFDAFRDYEERGNQFKQIVFEIGGKR